MNKNQAEFITCLLFETQEISAEGRGKTREGMGRGKEKRVAGQGEYGRRKNRTMRVGAGGEMKKSLWSVSVHVATCDCVSLLW